MLPWLPEVIGVVTSPTGAVIRDILHRLEDRFPRRVLVWPVKVQGEGSAEQIAAAIRGFNALPEGGKIPRPDVLIVARGGGSLEDLWSFNEEIVVRAAAESMIPLISAVGHETDITLIDFAADKRAPTPTAAAEMAVPVRSELLVEVSTLARRVMVCWQRAQESRRNELRAAARALPAAIDLLAIPRQRLDGAAGALPRALKANTHAHFRRFAGTSARLTMRVLRGQIAQATQRLTVSGERLMHSASRCCAIAGIAMSDLRSGSRRQGFPTRRRSARSSRATSNGRSASPSGRAARCSRAAAASSSRRALRPIVGRAVLSRCARPRFCAGARRTGPPVHAAARSDPARISRSNLPMAALAPPRTPIARRRRGPQGRCERSRSQNGRPSASSSRSAREVLF